MPPVGAVVEVIDPSSTTDVPCLIPRAIRINGVDVGTVVENGFALGMGDANNGVPVTVTLTLMPSQIIFRTAGREDAK